MFFLTFVLLFMLILMMHYKHNNYEYSSGIRFQNLI